MDNNMLDIINIAQLEILGVDKQLIYYGAFGLIVIIGSAVLYPIITLFIQQRYTFVFLYVISSLCIIIVSIVSIPFMNLFIELKVIVQFLSFYGFCIACFLVLQHMKQRKRHIP